MTHLQKKNMEGIDNLILVIQLRVSTFLCVKDVSEAMLSAPLMVGFMSVVKSHDRKHCWSGMCVSMRLWL